MELALMGHAASPSYRLLQSLFLPPLPSPSIARQCASIGSLQLRQVWRLSFQCHHGSAIERVPAFSSCRRVGKETKLLGRELACVRNSRREHGVVGSSWTKGADSSAPAIEQVMPKRSKSAGAVSTKKAENKDTTSRNLKEEGSSRVQVKRSSDKSRSKLDAPNSSSRSYHSRSRAQSSAQVQGEAGSDSKAQDGNEPVSGDAKGRRQFRDKVKQYAPEQDLRRQLDMCSKYANVKGALELYDKFKAEGKGTFNQYNYNIVLYLCSSAASNTLKQQKSGNERRGIELQKQLRGPLDELGVNVKSKNGAEPATATESEVMAEKERLFYMDRGFEVYEAMKAEGVPPNEATFTAVARLAVAKEDGDLAFEMVKQMAEAKLTPRLRSYSPALYTYCKLNNAEKAFEVDEHMKEAGVALEESELEALLRLAVDVELEDKVYALLHRLRATVRDVSPSVVEVIQKWFTSTAAASAGKSNWETLPSSETVKSATESCGGGWHGLGWLGKGSWEVKSTVVDGHGVCQGCGEQLVTIDLDPRETEMFAQSLSKLACQREARNNEFKKFQAWLDRHGPYDAIVDGANVGLYNSNSGNGAFNFYQLNHVVNGIQKKLDSKKEPLILLHHRRTKGGPAASSFATRTLNKWMDGNSIYTTPTGSNDDWYWLYAAVRYRCLLVTNDEMRDHLFSLLGNDFFPKWKERHQVRYTINQDGLTFHMPPPYSTVIQESEKGSWHVPKSSLDDDVLRPREWMCVTRAAPSNIKAEELELTVISSSTVSVTEIQTSLDSDLSVSSEETPSPKPRKARKSTSKSPKSATPPPSEGVQLEQNPTPRKRASPTTRKKSSPEVAEVEQSTSSESVPAPKKAPRSRKSPTLQVSEGEQPTPPKPKKSRSPKSSSSTEIEEASSQASKRVSATTKKSPPDVGEEPAPPKRRASAKKKSQEPETSVLFQKLEEAEKLRSGESIGFEI